MIFDDIWWYFMRFDEISWYLSQFDDIWCQLMHYTSLSNFSQLDGHHPSCFIAYFIWKACPHANNVTYLAFRVTNKGMLYQNELKWLSWQIYIFWHFWQFMTEMSAYFNQNTNNGRNGESRRPSSVVRRPSSSVGSYFEVGCWGSLLRKG